MLSGESELAQEEVQYVVQCRPPNLNPAKPDCMESEASAVEALKKCYANVLSAIAEKLAEMGT